MLEFFARLVGVVVLFTACVLIGIALFSTIARFRALPRNVCPKCGYSMRRGKNVCPECGTYARIEDRFAARGRQSGRLLAVLTGLGLLAFVILKLALR